MWKIQTKALKSDKTKNYVAVFFIMFDRFFTVLIINVVST
jgi:hypothetical protein